VAQVAVPLAGAAGQVVPQAPQFETLLAVLISQPSAPLSLQSRIVPEHAVHAAPAPGQYATFPAHETPQLHAASVPVAVKHAQVGKAPVLFVHE